MHHLLSFYFKHKIIMKKTLFLLVIAAMCCVSYLSAQNSVPKNYQKKYTSTYLEKWVDNQYIDKGIISNLDWLEYQYWLEKVFGKESKEYKAAMPNKKTLYQQLPDKVAKTYAESPAYRHQPVLGVSPEQAFAYCRWRTDRVAEQMLIKMKLLKYNPEQTKDDYFSLDKYQAPEGLQFLRFSLPTAVCETRYGFRCVAEWE